MPKDDATLSAASVGYATPLAWAVMNSNGHIYDIRITNPLYAQPLLPENDTAIPLVPPDSMRLTVAERCALASACEMLSQSGEHEVVEALRDLKERLS